MNNKEYNGSKEEEDSDSLIDIYILSDEEYKFLAKCDRKGYFI